MSITNGDGHRDFHSDEPRQSIPNKSRSHLRVRAQASPRRSESGARIGFANAKRCAARTGSDSEDGGEGPSVELPPRAGGGVERSTVGGP